MVNFDARQSYDPDGRIQNYEWSFWDGTSSRGASKSRCPHIYADGGIYIVNLTATDEAGDTSTKSFEVNPTEPLPEATFTYSPSAPKVGEGITFDASKSKDRTGRIINYN